MPLDQILAALETLSDDEAEAILFDWPTWARGEQLAPDWDWETWLINAGRGWGKTRTGAEWTRQKAQSCPIIHLVGPTAADARDVMVEGPAGILAISPKWDRPDYEPSKRRLTWPNGAIGVLFSAEEPERLRGPQCYAAWCDEIAAWKYLQDAWDNLQFGLRLGSNPQAACTTTPKPLKLIKALLADPKTAVTRGSTFDNAANLAKSALAKLRKKYEGTRIGRQELYAEILDDAPGALWQRDQIEANRVTSHPELQLIGIGVDPAATSGPDSDETGIVAGGLGVDRIGYPLAEIALRGSPLEWAREVVALYHKLRANFVVVEANNGGEMCRQTIHTVDPTVVVILVHASKAKQARAEPVAALAEQGRIRHVGGLPRTEDELCQWVPGQGMASPNLLDAYVWLFTKLMVDVDEPDTLLVYDDPVIISPI